MRIALLVSFLAVLGITWGCAEDDSAGPYAGDTSATPPPVWTNCSLVEEEDDGLAECISTPMPLFWDDADGPTIDIFAKRYRTTSPEFVGAQVWLIDGGPGGAASSAMPPQMAQISGRDMSIEVLAMDHRGTGYSGHLHCNGPDPNTAVQAESCLPKLSDDLGIDLEAYTVSSAARDLGAYIEAERREGVPVFVWGVSYGTFLVQRYLQIFPDQVDGVLLDGIMPPYGTLAWVNEGAARAADGLLEMCAADTFCQDKLGSDPATFARDVLSRVELGHCQINSNMAQWIRDYAAILLYNNSTMPVLPALFYRLDRCDAGDREALSNFFLYFNSNLMVAATVPVERLSRVLYNNITFSELWRLPEWPQDFDVLSYALQPEDAVVSFARMEDLYEISLFWPQYNDIELDNRWATTDVPMLMLQGELDPATRADKAVAVGDHFNGPSQTYVSFPTGGHGVANPGWFEKRSDCAYTMALGFISDPSAPVDPSCIDDVRAIDFAGDEVIANIMFGTDDLWEDGDTGFAATSSQVSSSIDSVKQREIDQLKDQLRRLSRRHSQYFR